MWNGIKVVFSHVQNNFPAVQTYYVSGLIEIIVIEKVNWVNSGLN